MKDDQRESSVVDKITEFASSQTTRRGFLGWLGKVGLTFAGIVGGVKLGLGNQSLVTYASSNATCPPPSYGVCTCKTSIAIGPHGAKCTCLGNCSEEVFFQANIRWIDYGTGCFWYCACNAC